MRDATGHLTVSKDSTLEGFRHLPDAIALEATVASIRGDVLPEPDGERNAFIAAAVEAGG